LNAERKSAHTKRGARVWSLAAAIDEFKKLDRIIGGKDNNMALELPRELYMPFYLNRERVISIEVKSVELTRVASNAMLDYQVQFYERLGQFY